MQIATRTVNELTSSSYQRHDAFPEGCFAREQIPRTRREVDHVSHPRPEPPGKTRPSPDANQHAPPLLRACKPLPLTSEALLQPMTPEFRKALRARAARTNPSPPPPSLQTAIIAHYCTARTALSASKKPPAPCEPRPSFHQQHGASAQACRVRGFGRRCHQARVLSRHSAHMNGSTGSVFLAEKPHPGARPHD